MLYPKPLIRFFAVLLFVGVPSFAASASGTAKDSGPEDSKPKAPHAVVLTGEDWQTTSRKPLTADEIDQLIRSDLQSRGLNLAPLTTDEQFLRRVSLDLTGKLPTPEEIKTFLADTRGDKRARLIDRLLESDHFARHWARFWRDVVTVRLTMRRSMGLTRAFEEWLFEQIRADRNWGAITQDILTAKGEMRFTLNKPSPENGQLFFLVAHGGEEAEERAAETSRVFLGIQIQCAQCHDHPFEDWTRKQFHELAAYFPRIKYKQLFIKKKLSGVHLIQLEAGEHKMNHSGEETDVHPVFLNGQSPGENLTDLERRRALANSITSTDNYWFSASYVNRVWNEVMGWSFYPHVDDLGANKKVIYAKLLTRMVGSFRGSNYDMKALFRALMNSKTYQQQLSVDVPASGYTTIAGVAPTRLRPDALWDSLAHVLGKIQHGYRFHTQSGVRFNKTFLQGKFQAEFDYDPSCDKTTVHGTLPQALMMINNTKLSQRVKAKPGTLLHRLLKKYEDDRETLDQLYKYVLVRRPTEREALRCIAYLNKVGNRTEAFEDILWALINSTEFQTRR